MPPSSSSSSSSSSFFFNGITRIARANSLRSGARAAAALYTATLYLVPESGALISATADDLSHPPYRFRFFRRFIQKKCVLYRFLCIYIVVSSFTVSLCIYTGTRDFFCRHEGIKIVSVDFVRNIMPQLLIRFTYDGVARIIIARERWLLPERPSCIIYYHRCILYTYIYTHLYKKLTMEKSKNRASSSSSSRTADTIVILA